MFKKLAGNDRLLITGAIVAAIAYCSWPLGYWLNPTIGRVGLASELGASHQPYNWFFVLCDVIAGAVIFLVAVAIASREKHAHSRYTRGMAFSLALFGVLTCLDALLPLPCLPSHHQCGDIYHNSDVLIHGIAGIIGAMMLFIGLLLTIPPIKHMHASAVKRRWQAVTGLLLLGWGLFGVGSLLAVLFDWQGNTSQHLFIMLCSLCIVSITWISISSVKRRASA